MNVTLIHPAGSNWMPGKRDVSAAANRMAPLGLLSMAAWLERRGHRARVLDCLGPRAPKTPEAAAARALEGAPGLVGISATTSAFLDGYDIALALKARRPEIRIVFGGAHISALGERLLRDFPAIDFLCVGEGEETLAELADGREPAAITGLVRRDGETIRANPPRPQLPDLDALPFPAYEKLDGFPHEYHLPLFSYIDAPGATMTTSRGCPYQCSYCDRSVFKRGYRAQSPEYVYEHVRYLRERFGVRHINVYDDLFTADRRRIERLCGLLTDRPPGARFNCAVRVGHADPELLAMLRRAGCLMVSLGIESAEPSLLALHKPGVYLEAVRETVARIHAAGLRAKGLFIMGLPGETEASAQATSDFALSLGLDDMNMAKFTPFPGAPAWRDIADHGEFREDWRLMNCLNFVFLPRGIASWDRLEQLYNTHLTSSPA